MKYREWKTLSKENKSKVKWKDLPAMNKFARVFVLGVIFFVGAIFVLAKSQDEMPDNEMAFDQAKVYVRSGLKSPKSATFPNKEYTVSINNNDSTFVVRSFVDAKNSFNVDIRSNWIVKMKYLGNEKFVLLNIDVK